MYRDVTVLDVLYKTETVYLAVTKLECDKTYATGQDETWAKRTLKRRLKKKMMGILGL